MSLESLNSIKSIKEQREELLKLNPDLLAGVYSIVEEKDGGLKLELAENILTCYPNQFQGLRGLKDNSDITIINLGALRKGKVEVFFGNNVEGKNLVLLSNGVIELVEAQNKNGDIRKHLISTLRDGGAVDELQRTTTAGRNTGDDLYEDLEKEHIEESPFLGYDRDGKLALAIIDNSAESIEILRESIKFFLDRKYLKSGDINYEYAKKNFERNFPGISYDDLRAILIDIIDNNRIFTYSVEEENGFKGLGDNMKEISLGNSKGKYFVYFDKDNNTIEYRLIRTITGFNGGFKLLSKRPSRLYLESENQYPRIPRVENASKGYVPTVKYFRDKVKLTISDIIELNSEVNEYDDLPEEAYERYLAIPDEKKEEFLKKYKKKYKSRKPGIRNKKTRKWLLDFFGRSNLNHFPGNILIRLLEYIENKKKYDDLDCRGFVLFLYSSSNLKYLGGNIDIGDIVGFGERSVFYNGRQEFKSNHFGIYIGNGKYLSKLGRGHDNVVVMSEKNLLKMYKSLDVGKYIT
nr:hypothetical protein [Candidatus Gracilibacteria bacterium]